MSDIDAVRAYRTALRSTYVSRDGDECGRTYNLVDEDAADALIAALGDEIAELTGQNIDLEVWRASAVKRAEQAEADLAAWRAFCDEWVDIAFEVQQQDHKRYTQAEAEVERLTEQATVLLDSIFQTVDPEDGEAIVAEAFPTGAPQWALDWYAEHPSEEEFKARAEKEATDAT